MRIALITPKNAAQSGRSFYDYEFYSSFLFSRRSLSYLLAIPTLISLTPPEHEIKVFDENIEDIDYSWKPDIVGISVRTMFANRAYAIAAAYRKLGVPTVLGGIHASMCPEETLEHCDSVVIGEAENIWPQLLEDARDGLLKEKYTSEKKTDLKNCCPPSRKSLSRERYVSDVVQTSKGCPFHCEFCSVYAFDGQQMRSKSVDQVIQEITEINNSGSEYKKKSAVFFVDDNIIGNRKYARELFTALKPHNINWVCQASVNIAQDESLLELMHSSGCGAVFIGLESLEPENLDSMHKEVNQRVDYAQAIQTIQSHGILVHGSFIVGSDGDTPETLQRTIDFIQKNNLLMPLINILTPLPGTELFKRLERDGRIHHKDWSRYDTRHVVFEPSGMKPQALFDGYRKIVQTVYSFDSIWKKLNHYWKIDFWKKANEQDPVRLKYRLLFALRLCSLLFSTNTARSGFILKVLPRVFQRKVRISSILTLMAYNDFAAQL